MPFIHWVNNVSASQQAVKYILLSQPAVVGLAFKLYSVGITDEVVIVQVSTWNQEVFLFDLRTDKDIMYDGELWRVLQSDDLLKVTHDCRHASRTLKNQFKTELRQVFDTQAAYSIMLMSRELPARQILLDELHIKFGDEDEKVLSHLKVSVETPGFFWSQRPLSGEKMDACAADVIALVPTLYENINRLLSDENKNLTHQLSEAYLCGKVKSVTYEEPISTATPRLSRLKKSAPDILTDEQRLFLNNTIPKAASVQ